MDHFAFVPDEKGQIGTCLTRKADTLRCLGHLPVACVNESPYLDEWTKGDKVTASDE